MLKFFFYDEELKVFIDKATNKVQYLEHKVFIKKILMFTLIVLLAIICGVGLLLKLM